MVALDGIDLSAESATILAVLGPNGAGKTTAVRILTTLLLPDGGRAEVAGFDVVRDAVRLRSVIGLAGQNAAVDPHLTGRENLELVGRLYHLPQQEARRRREFIETQLRFNDSLLAEARGALGAFRAQAPGLAGERSLEPDHGRDALGRFGRVAVAPRAVVTGRPALGHGLLAHLLQLVGRTITIVSMSPRQHLAEIRVTGSLVELLLEGDAFRPVFLLIVLQLLGNMRNAQPLGGH